MGPESSYLNPCQDERMLTKKYKSHSPTQVHLGITQIITKAYQVIKFNPIITYLHNFNV